MKLTAITTCVGFDDYLRVCVKENEGLFDDWIIVTTPGDPCHDIEGVRFHETDAFYRDGAPFNKGAAINSALMDYNHEAEWLVLLDGDIILPSDWRKKINVYPLDRNNIYGLYRNDCWDLPAYLGGDLSGLTPSHGNQHRGLGVGAFCLFHWCAETMQKRREDGGPLYPVEFKTAVRSDRFHLKRWLPQHREDTSKARSSAIAFGLPQEIFGRLVHFGTDCLRNKGNHKGRTTPRIDK